MYLRCTFVGGTDKDDNQEAEEDDEDDEDDGELADGSSGDALR